MWISFFMISIAIALGFGLGAVVLESREEAKPLHPSRQR
jgi:hypothetical protein